MVYRDCWGRRFVFDVDATNVEVETCRKEIRRHDASQLPRRASVPSPHSASHEHLANSVDRPTTKAGQRAPVHRSMSVACSGLVKVSWRWSDFM
jgi:hypothetical protein